MQSHFPNDPVPSGTRANPRGGRSHAAATQYSRRSDAPIDRRCFLQAAIGAAQLGLLLTLGLTPRRILANWPAKGFHAETLADAERLLFGDAAIRDSDHIRISAPDVAENGANVPVEVRITLENPRTLFLFSEKNPYPLLARARLTAALDPVLSLRVKMAGSGDLVAVVETDGGYYRSRVPVEVTTGGCGT
jgi:sulfur-oxidizing protein SoxY